MNSLRHTLTLLIGSAALLASGCIQRGSDGLPVVTEMADPADVSKTLSAPNQRWSGDERALDLNLLRTTQREVGRMTKNTRSHAAAVVWSDAAMAGYLADPLTPWLEEALANAQNLLDQPDEATADPIAALIQWAAWVEARSGFQVAMPIYLRAETLVGPDGARPMPLPVNDASPKFRHDGVQEARLRLAALYREQPDVWIGSYAFARANAWLDFAIDEATRQDRSGVVDDALAEFDGIVNALIDSRSGRGLRDALQGWSARHERFDGANEDRLRDDLWLISKQHNARLRADYMSFDRNAATLARLDVVLLQAEHEHHQRGLPAARPYLLEAESIVSQINASSTSQP